MKTKKTVTKKKKANNIKAKKVKFTTKEEILEESLRRIHKLESLHEQKKNEHTKSDTLAFYTFLFMVLITNFFLSFIIVFLIVFLEHPLLYIVIIILGVGFGLIYERLLNGMSHIFIHHHVFAKIFLVVSGVITVFFIVSFTSIIFNFFGLENRVYNHVAISVTYFVSYLLPYFFAKAVK